MGSNGDNGAPSPVTVQAFANLALVKYWGKADAVRNLPATASVGVNLDELTVKTTISGTSDSKHTLVRVNGREQAPERYAAFFASFREATGYTGAIVADSTASFPQSAGLASSAAGFAALALGCAEYAKTAGSPPLPAEAVSALARLGSGSAARAVIGGFSLLPAGGIHATQLMSATAWPDFRIVVATVTNEAKKIGSREAMERTRETSPYYGAWTEDAQRICNEATSAVERRDIEALGELMRLSYLRMHASMLAASPPIRYWKSKSLDVLDACEELRRRGIAAYETMDAGPQVKIATTAADVEQVREAVSALGLAAEPLVCTVAEAPRVIGPGRGGPA
ncbi:MAG: diphosphomevalonate decarboxylase [Spirochaetes bacterium]|jgi:diphosphomevalonate decarboxylase|nr:diphosphomevalonate decarboxylase [Spirochaetota bacterium]